MSVNSPSATSSEPRKRPVQARSRALVERILDAAARIFETRGYRDTTTNHVAELAGVSIGSLYQYFPNKDALLVGLAERHLDEAVPRLADVSERLRRDEPDIATVCRTLVAEIDELNRSDRLHRLLWVSPRTAEIEARLGEVERLMIDDVAWHLRRVGHGPVAADRRARLLVEVVGAAVHADVPPDEADAWRHELERLVVPYAESTG